MVLCTIGSGEFLIGRRELSEDYLTNFLKKVQTKQSKQSAIYRYQRFLLLVNLCRDFRSSKEDIETNLLYFMKYHGILIETEEESKLWNDVLQGNDLFDSTASLSFHYYKNLQECFLFHPESMFCYESCSALHQDGFYELSKAFPNLIDHYRYKVTAPKSLCLKYIQAWPNEKRQQELKDGKAGRDGIKAVCYQGSKSLKREEFDRISDWIKQWDLDSANHKHRTRYPIDMKELRALLTETAIAGTIVHEARKYLSQQIRAYYTAVIKLDK